MSHVQIYTELFGQENSGAIISSSNVGNLSSTKLQTADGLRTFLCGKNCVWDEEMTTILNEDQSFEDIRNESFYLFQQLNEGTIEAIQCSIPALLLLQQQPEFGGES